jgi:hypothetical protein
MEVKVRKCVVGNWRDWRERGKSRTDVPPYKVPFCLHIFFCSYQIERTPCRSNRKLVSGSD